MSRRTFLASFISFAVLACGSTFPPVDDGPPNSGPSTASTEGAGNGRSLGDGRASAEQAAVVDPTVAAADARPQCAAAVPVATAAEVLAAVAGGPSWQSVSLGKNSVLQIGADLLATADIDLEATAITAPASCTDTQTPPSPFVRCHAPLFRAYAFPRWQGALEGVTCLELGDRPARKGDTCTKLRIANGTRLRFRSVVEDMHPTAPIYWPFLEVEKPCSAPCGAGELRCIATQTCLAAGPEVCAHCEGASTATCACREGAAVRTDGTKCSFDTSPDTVKSGTCRRGVCASP